jgi:hypothetical protein
MPAIILLAFLSLSAFARQNWCDFDTTFSEKYLEARKKYAQRLSSTRSTTEPEHYNYGKKRAISHGATWTPLSIKQKTKDLFGDAELEFLIKDNGKLLIYPKGTQAGEKLIIMDPSGDYFRISRTRVKDGVVNDSQVYCDANGNERKLHKSMSKEEWDDITVKTHFKALP